AFRAVQGRPAAAAGDVRPQDLPRVPGRRRSREYDPADRAGPEEGVRGGGEEGAPAGVDGRRGTGAGGGRGEEAGRAARRMSRYRKRCCPTAGSRETSAGRGRRAVPRMRPQPNRRFDAILAAGSLPTVTEIKRTGAA